MKIEAPTAPLDPKDKESVLSGPVASPRNVEHSEKVKKSTRLLSLDFYRGLIMVLLMLEAAGLYRHTLALTEPTSFRHSFAFQFQHHPWHGLMF